MAKGLATSTASKPMTATTFSTKRIITLELTKRECAQLACAISVGCSKLPLSEMDWIDAKDVEILYCKVSDAIFPE